MKNQFELAQEKGLSTEQTRKLNMLRGCVIGSVIPPHQKKELCNFVQELENFFGEENMEEEE